MISDRQQESINSQRSGFTLIELLVTMGVAGIIATVSVVGFMALSHSAAIRQATDTLVEAVSRAHNEAVNNLQGDGHGVYIETDQLTLYRGAHWGSHTVEHIFDLPSSASISSGSGTDIAFNRLSGLTTPQTIIISNGSRTRTVSIAASGVIDIQ